MCNVYKGIYATKRFACYNHLDRIGGRLLFNPSNRVLSRLENKRRYEA
jgi:hypothetical protein